MPFIVGPAANPRVSVSIGTSSLHNSLSPPQLMYKLMTLLSQTGQQLHELLEERRILHLIFAGFATNWCVLGRDYGIRSMSRYGYNIVLLRDATTGVEFPDTYDNLFTTEIAIREVEQQYGFSASNADFFAAVEGLSGL